MPRHIPLLESYCPLEGGLTSLKSWGMAASGEESHGWAEVGKEKRDSLTEFAGLQSGGIS